jgi:hypothetical protein
MKKYLSFCVLLLLLSCHESSKRQSREKAEKLYSEGMKILDQRLLIQDSDKEKAMELNEKAIEKFTSSYTMDTTFDKPASFASECSMYARDYQDCLIWTLRLQRLDTSQSNKTWINERIQECKSHLLSE